MPQDPVEDFVERMEEMDHADHLPFLRLPNELISKTLSYASLKDRMAVRGVCKRLNAIEAETKCYIKNLLICDRRWYMQFPHLSRPDGTQHIIYDNESPSDFMRFLERVSNNASVGYLYSKFFGSNQIEPVEFYEIVKKFNAKHVIVGVSSSGMSLEGFLIDMARKCHDFSSNIRVPVAELHEVYKGMVDNSMKLRHLSLTSFNPSTYTSFLDHIGIRFESDQFFSNKDIEVYAQDQYPNHFFIFDGNLIIEWWQITMFEMVRHETTESLEEEKNKVKNEEGMVRLIVAPIEE